MFTLYKGPSQLDGQPIGHFATGLESPSRNPKTGPMIQTFILRTDMTPLEAVSSGADESICGSCPMRGTGGKGRSCYVSLFRAPTQVYRHTAASKEPKLHTFNNQAIRFGAYGDPAAVPVDGIARLARRARMSTGYTHQWRTCDQDFKKYLMASCDNLADYELAKSMGWRTFRVKSPDQPKLITESVCPASEEGGRMASCLTCGRCNGTEGRTKDVVIDVHGSGRRSFLLLPQ